MGTIDDVAFCVNAFERPGLVRRMINSILAQYPGAKIYVADQSARSHEYPGATKVWKLDYDVGVCAGRNHCIRSTDEPFVVQLDDDYLFTEETDILYLAELLESDDSLVMAGTKCRHIRPNRRGWTKYYADVWVDNGVLYAAKPSRPARKFQGRPFQIVDVISNFWVAKRRLFDDVLWDERYKIGGEHADFFLRVQLANGDPSIVKQYESQKAGFGRKGPIGRVVDPGRFQVAFVPSLLVDHMKNRPPKYQRLRKRDVDGEKLFRRIWGVHRVKRWRKEAVPKKVF